MFRKILQQLQHPSSRNMACRSLWLTQRRKERRNKQVVMLEEEKIVFIVTFRLHSHIQVVVPVDQVKYKD